MVPNVLVAPIKTVTANAINKLKPRSHPHRGFYYMYVLYEK